jgi:hypothetical protein
MKIKPKIELQQNRETYFAELQQSLEDTKNAHLISFTEEEFDIFIKALKINEIPSKHTTLEI